MCFRGFAAKDFILRAFIFYARPRVKNECTPKYYFPARALLNNYKKDVSPSKYNLVRSAERTMSDYYKSDMRLI